MNDTATCYNNSPTYNQSTVPFNLANYVSNIISDPTLSKNASTTLVQLTLSAGRKGYCELLIYSISVKVKSSRTQTKIYLKELQDKKRIKIIYRTGRSSIYQLLDILPEKEGPSRFSDYIKEIKKRKNQRSERTKSNVIFNFPEKTNPPSTLATDNKIIIKNSIQPHDTEPTKPILHQQQKPIKTTSNVVNMTLVQEILQVTNDKKSLNCFIKIVKNCPENVIFAAISSLKIALSEGIVSKPGAYFVQTIKNYCPDLFTVKLKQPMSQPKLEKNVSFPINIADSEPKIQPDWEINLALLKNIQQILNKPSHRKVI